MRLPYPVVHLRYQFAKGFYVRYSDRLHGRVARLFYFPFVKALRDIIGKIDFLEYMADFRYPLSGEFAIFASIAYDLVFPSDWGIEVGILAEMYRITRPHRICQVEITSRYDHKHQEAGEDPKAGLMKMVSDIARTFFTHLASGGSILTRDFLRTLKHTYLANARSYVRIYESYAEMNSLKKFDRHQELGLIEVFAGALDNAFGEYQNHPFGSSTIPDWRRIEVALDGILPELVNAFENHSAASDMGAGRSPGRANNDLNDRGAPASTVRRRVILEGTFSAMVSCVIDRGYSCSSFSTVVMIRNLSLPESFPCPQKRTGRPSDLASHPAPVGLCGLPGLLLVGLSKAEGWPNPSLRSALWKASLHPDGWSSGSIFAMAVNFVCPVSRNLKRSRPSCSIT